MDIAQMIGSGAGCAVILMTLIQISPIKIDPWSALARCIGNAINCDIKNELKEIKDDLKEIRSEADQRNAVSARTRILRFNDELLNDINHSKDYFDQILSDVDTYEKYCNDNPDFKNNMTVFAVENIKKCYQNCMTKHKFL